MLRGHAGDDASHVLVVGIIDGRPLWATRGGRRDRKARPVEPDPPPPELPVTRLTVIDATPFPAPEAAASWLKRSHDPAYHDPLVTRAAGVVNRAVHIFRVSSTDPRVREISREETVTLRIGIGRGDQVADGQWTDALTLPPRSKREKKSGRAAMLRPQERLAAVLAGREVVLACESLALRARLDLDAGRIREAALQTHLALEAAVAELAAWRELAGVGRRVDELETRRDACAEAANEALQGGLAEESVEVVEAALSKIEAALRARMAASPF